MKDSTATILGVVGSLLALISPATYGVTAVVSLGIGIFLLTKTKETKKAKGHGIANVVLGTIMLLLSIMVILGSLGVFN